jgi:hypothetical protein
MSKIFTAENHHEVLPFWADYRRNGGEMPVVLTIDHHTDVVRAFRDDSRIVSPGTWSDAESVQCAVEELKHDEHFDWAVRAGLIKSAYIASHTCATTPANEALHICCDPAWPDENVFFQDTETYRKLADSVLESDYLYRQFGEIEQYGKFIFDIDCDCILCEKSLHPSDGTLLSQLLKRSVLITISLESDWVRLLKLPGEKLTSQEIAEKLLLFLKK